MLPPEGWEAATNLRGAWHATLEARKTRARQLAVTSLYTALGPVVGRRSLGSVRARTTAWRGAAGMFAMKLE